MRRKGKAGVARGGPPLHRPIFSLIDSSITADREEEEGGREFTKRRSIWGTMEQRKNLHLSRLYRQIVDYIRTDNTTKNGGEVASARFSGIDTVVVMVRISPLLFDILNLHVVDRHSASDK